jgi:hypothetical protein
MNVHKMATRNFEQHLRANRYPGRGLVIGRTESEDWAMIYWIMGRSENSRNRRFVSDGEILRTEPIDAGKVANPELIIYEAMLTLPGTYLVSNGDQTRTLANAISAGGRFDEALCTREREPDAPNYTPRISGMLRLLDKKCPVTLSILKANAADPDLTDRFTYRPAPPPPGFGYGLTTYMGDGDPLPSFNGDPLLLPLRGSAEALLAEYWQALDKENRVALAVKWLAGGKSRTLLQNR